MSTWFILTSVQTIQRQLWKNIGLWPLKSTNTTPGMSHGWRSGDGRGGKAPLSAPSGEGKGDGWGDGGLALQPHLNQRFVNLAMSFGTTGNSRRSPCSLTEHAFLITRFLLHNPVEQGLQPVLEEESVFQRFAK